MGAYAALSKVNFGAHGYAASFILSVFDRDWKQGLTVEYGLEIARRCLHELRTRFVISQPHFITKIVDSNGICVVEMPLNIYVIKLRFFAFKIPNTM